MNKREIKEFTRKECGLSSKLIRLDKFYRIPSCKEYFSLWEEEREYLRDSVRIDIGDIEDHYLYTGKKVSLLDGIILKMLKHKKEVLDSYESSKNSTL